MILYKQFLRKKDIIMKRKGNRTVRNLAVASMLLTSAVATGPGCSSNYIIPNQYDEEILSDIDEILAGIDESFIKEEHEVFGARKITEFKNENLINDVLLYMKIENSNYVPAYDAVIYQYSNIRRINSDKGEIVIEVTPGIFPLEDWLPYKGGTYILASTINLDEVAVNYNEGYFIRVGTQIYLVHWENRLTEPNMPIPVEEKSKSNRQK
jgi:hypothetical protein